jgi:hypothetical protein
MLAAEFGSWYEELSLATASAKGNQVVEATYWWDGQVLASEEVALALFAPAPSVAPAATTPVGTALGAAAGGERTVLLPPDRLGAFLKLHAKVTLICVDAAALHWRLHDILANQHDSDAQAALWGFSADARLIDLRLLDLHLRRLTVPQATVAASSREVVARVTGVELPADEELCREVLEVTTSPSSAVMERADLLVARFAHTLLAAYAALMLDVRSRLQAVVAELLRLGRLGGRNVAGKDVATLCEEGIVG